MIYYTIILLLTNRCNLECSHCCIECSPKNDGAMDDMLIEKVISELATNPKIKTIGISGGESFLYPDKVKKAVHLIGKIGKAAAVYTNGFWCHDYMDTYNTLYDLKKNGLSLLLTSIDTYHQKHIPVDNLKNLLRACNELDILVKIHVSTTYSNAEENDLLISSLGLAKLSASITSSEVFPVGRAASNIEKNDIISNKNLHDLKCPNGGMCSVDWEGNVLWCCALHNKNMMLGNVRNENVNNILNNFRKSTVYMSLLTKGLSYLASIIQEHNLMPLNETYTNGCEFCNSIFENKELVEKLEKFL